MASQTVIAHFDSRSDAEKCMEAMVEAGISRTSMRMLPDAETSGYQRSSSSSYDYNRDEGGFWSSLGSLFLPSEDRAAYAEGMSRGGVTLSVTTDDAHVERVAEIAERYGAVDMDERERSWRSEGWTGYSPGTTDVTAAGTSSGMPGTAEGMAMGSGTRAAMGATSARTGEEVIPVVEEELRVGKRQVQSGRVRIRSYVVETPVEEQVSLRQEHVHVERRPADRALNASDDALFQERVIEAEERSEEAVVSKEARVKEELVVRKDVEEETRTVQDTVRRTEVDIEDERAGSRSGTSMGGTTRDPL